MFNKVFFRIFFLLSMLFCALQVQAQAVQDYRLGAGDSIHITVFQHLDLTIDTRVSEKGIISFPMLGMIEIGGLTIDDAAQKIADGLKKGGFVDNAQVNIALVQIRGNQVSVLGQVGRPGRFPLDTSDIRVSGMLAIAGGIMPTGSDVVILTGQRNGKPFRKEIDIASLFLGDNTNNDVLLENGDVIYVHRYPMFYIYGEVQRPGSYRIERSMTVMQALAQGGGPTMRGTERSLKLFRREEGGKVAKLSPSLTDQVKDGDVLFINESLF